MMHVQRCIDDFDEHARLLREALETGGTLPDPPVLQSPNENPDVIRINALYRSHLQRLDIRARLTGVVDDIPPNPDEENALSEVLWTAQNAVIEGEIKYLSQLQREFKERKQETEQHKTKILEFFEDLISGSLSAAAAKTIAGVSGALAPILAPLAGFLTQFGIGMLFDELALWLTEGNALCDGLIAEDKAIKEIEMSSANYRHREAILARHTQQIHSVLDQISRAEAGLRQGTTLAGDNFAEYFKKAFLDESGEGFMDRRLKDLKYNEQVLELPGGTRLHLTSRLIDYPG